MSDTVLVVDDEQSIRTALRLMLKYAGYQVVEARDGHEAVQRVADQPPAVVLLDWHMPRMDGQQCCKVLHASIPDLPVVLMTAGYRAEAAALACGATSCLPKPFDLDTVLDTVAHWLPVPHR